VAPELIDLHTHSNRSDGTDTPAELVRAAAAAGLSAIAITDHDTTAGWADAAAALPPGLRLVRGAELSCESRDGRGGWCTVHLLAYLFDPSSPVIVTEQARLRVERRRRLRLMAAQMAAEGLPVDADEIFASLPPDAPAGRPHLAAALIKAGVVSSVDEAFASYLRTGGPYHIGRADTPVLDAIQMIAEAGGITVLAHGFARHRGRTVTPDVVKELAAAGLGGVEVNHPDHTPENRADLLDLAADLGLLVTGSSDYHGGHKTIRLGQESTAPDMLDAIVERATGAELLTGS
jgi:predicted metal-dependent phosphoesterase TrpH